ncbi:MAG: hypothetical protein ACLP8S_31295 [Solirubrobacteraceae bacterium]
MKRLAILITGAVLALSVAGNAMAAGSSTCQAYNPQTCVSTTTTVSTATTSTLPFTGLDVALLLAGGAGLVGTGLVVRRISRRLN